jgi:hypothetical protein
MPAWEDARGVCVVVPQAAVCDPRVIEGHEKLDATCRWLRLLGQWDRMEWLDRRELAFA